MTMQTWAVIITAAVVVMLATLYNPVVGWTLAVILGLGIGWFGIGWWLG